MTNTFFVLEGKVKEHKSDGESSPEFWLRQVKLIMRKPQHDLKQQNNASLFSSSLLCDEPGSLEAKVFVGAAQPRATCFD